MNEALFLFLMIVILALVFDYINGFHDTANAIATVISTRVLSPRAAVFMAAVLNFAGALMGTEVAKTIGAGIVNVKIVEGCQALVLAALVGAIIWNLITWYLGLPSSSSHALIGGLIGAAIAYRGVRTLNVASIMEKVVLPLVMSPFAGFTAGFLFMLALSWIFCKSHPHTVRRVFGKLQLVSSAFMALSHGTNDAQKSMGIITLALFLFGYIPTVEVPLWVKLACACAMAMGTSSGGWRIIKTMGHKIFKLETIHGFAAETSAALVITTATHFGAPISTTHVISSSILGVGATKRLSAVKWGIAGNIVVAWILTIPASALISALIFWLVDLIGLC
ncbi:MAG: inorganic phosphate transporter [Candidatus Eremiobacteraeota bacterium]|nr:inorganic phosphate transporter [Candidatus Eremiobacteraeota bacterium]